jgi:hypothetical protein
VRRSEFAAGSWIRPLFCALDLRGSKPIWHADLSRIREDVMAKTAKKTTASDGHEAHQFQAEVAKLLHLMVHSVYSDRDVFLR